MARTRVFNPKNITSHFRSTGIFRFNPASYSYHNAYFSDEIDNETIYQRYVVMSRNRLVWSEGIFSSSPLSLRRLSKKIYAFVENKICNPELHDIYFNQLTYGLFHFGSKNVQWIIFLRWPQISLWPSKIFWFTTRFWLSKSTQDNIIRARNSATRAAVKGKRLASTIECHEILGVAGDNTTKAKQHKRMGIHPAF